MDDKEIEKAALDYCAKCLDITNRNVDLDKDECVDLYNSFIDSAKWMQKKFLKDLWHPDNEKPKSNSNILIKIKAYRLVLYPEGKKEDICGYFYEVIKYNKKDKWKLTELEKKYHCDLKVIQWLYIKDLLPKE